MYSHSVLIPRLHWQPTRRQLASWSAECVAGKRAKKRHPPHVVISVPVISPVIKSKTDWGGRLGVQRTTGGQGRGADEVAETSKLQMVAQDEEDRLCSRKWQGMGRRGTRRGDIQHGQEVDPVLSKGEGAAWMHVSSSPSPRSQCPHLEEGPSSCTQYKHPFLPPASPCSAKRGTSGAGTPLP